MVSTVSTTVSEEMMVEFKAEITPVQLFVSDYTLLFSKNQRTPSSLPTLRQAWCHSACTHTCEAEPG